MPLPPPAGNGIEHGRDQGEGESRRETRQQGRALPAAANARGLEQFRRGLAPLQVRQRVRRVRNIQHAREPAVVIHHR